MTLDTGLDGLGRFGLHLLRYWLDRRGDAAFRIAAINDPALSLETAVALVADDPDVRFDDFDVTAQDGCMTLAPRRGDVLRFPYSRTDPDEIPWLGEVDLLLEASGRLTDAERCRRLLRGRTRRIVVGASCEGSDQTLVFGFNHDDWSADSRVLSYGSCTVNAFVPLAAWIHDAYGLLDADLNVVHNTPRHRLRPALERRACTLEAWGPRLLPFLDAACFAVNYTTVPLPGVSLLDFRFRVARPPSRAALLADLGAALRDGALAGRFRLEPTAQPLASYLGAPENAILVADALRVRQDQLYLHALCDTENSAARYFDLVDYIARRLSADLAEPASGTASKA